MLINSWPNKGLLGYSFKEQIVDILPGIFMAVFMGGIISTIRLLGLSDIVTILIQVPLGAFIYIVLSYILKIESFEYILSMVKSFIKR